jgi:hypothetical protein
LAEKEDVNCFDNFRLRNIHVSFGNELKILQSMKDIFLKSKKANNEFNTGRALNFLSKRKWRCTRTRYLLTLSLTSLSEVSLILIL